MEFIHLPAMTKEDLKGFKPSNVFGRLEEGDVMTFEKIKIFKASIGKVWKIYPNGDEKSFFEAIVVDGHNKRNTVQIFTQSMQTNACTCDDFIENQLGYCQHLAAITRVYRQYYVTGCDVATYIRNRIPQLALKMRVYCGKKIRIFFPTENKFITFLGMNKEGTNVTDAVSCLKANLQTDYNDRFNERYAHYSNIVTTGILQGGIELYDYQQDIMKKMIAAQRCICSMIMGSGKTLTSIAIYEWLRTNEIPNAKLLIISPKPLKIQWANELRRATGVSAFQISDEDDIKEYASSQQNVGIVTYQLIARYPDLFAAMKHDIIILDEMQYVRNKETKAWNAISRLKTDYMFGLSGTIIENRLDDLYSVLNILAPGFMGPLWKFKSEYQNMISFSSSVIHYNGVKNLEPLRHTIRNLVFSYDKIELPNIHHHQIKVALSDRERIAHEDYYAQAQILLAKAMKEELSPGEKMRLQALLLKSRQCTNTFQLISKDEGYFTSGKLDKIIELVSSFCVEQDKKVVIFSTWVEMLHIIGEHIKARCPSVEFVYFTGQENEKKKAVNLEKFKNNSKCRVFLASESGGTGLDGLQQSSHVVIHTELPWNPAKVDQRNARLHRNGQVNEVFVYYLIGEDSIETTMLETLYEKREVRQKVLYDEVVSETPVETPVSVIVPEKKSIKISKKPLEETRKLQLRF